MPRTNRGAVVAILFLALLPSQARPQEAALATAADRARLRTLRPGHPRLIGLDTEIARARAHAEQHPTARAWLQRLREEADRVVTEPVSERRLIGPRLLSVSRRVMARVYTLGLLYRLEGNRRYAERARAELLAVCAFQDWNPPHFLDTAEMSHAVGIGYDWLHDYLSAEDRAVIRKALVEKGLRPGVAVYRSGRGWPRNVHNWNQVCNGGLTVGALAIADEEPDLAAYVIGQAVASVPRALASYAPDGGWAEGPGYWNYATRYTVYMLAALRTALGTDFGLSDAPGLREAGLFRVHFVGPIGRTFNYADGGDREGSADCLFWLARRYRLPLYAWAERKLSGSPTALDLLWFDPAGRGPRADRIPTAARFSGIDVVLMRTSWEDPDATFVGFKGGDNRANHRHLDLGTFVMDAIGKRWAVDLGADDYNMPAYFGARPRYYRQRTAGHNVLLLDGADQSLTAKAPIERFSAGGRRAVADLTAAYAGQARSVRRGVAILPAGAVLVQDELEADAPVEVAWQMHTPAAVTLQGDRAQLAQGGAMLEVRVMEPAGVTFAAEPATAPAPQNPNLGITRLVLRLPSKVASARIVVLLTPAGVAAPAGLPTAPLGEWK